MSSTEHQNIAKRYRITAIPGDGIGGEVMPIAVEVLQATADIHGFEVDIVDVDWGCQRYLTTGSLAPEGWLDSAQASDAILLGAVGYPGVPDHLSLWELLIPIRRRFDQYVNLRPLKSFPDIPGALARDPKIDLVIVRENSEGEYTQVGGRMFTGTQRELVLQEAVFTRYGVERIARYACELAVSRKGHLVAATKSNGLVHTMPFWDELVKEIASEYAVELEIQHVDALAARLVTAPDKLDVILASNLMGDILSDLGAAVIGGLGLAASGNINPDRAWPSMFEPVHGSAPDIAGQGAANPVGQVLSVVMMLHHLGEQEAAIHISTAVEEVIGRDNTRSRDLGGRASTEQIGAAILARIQQRPLP